MNVMESKYYSASSMQKRMYMLWEFDKESLAYNMPKIFKIEGKIDEEKIENTFRKLIEKHETLRTYFNVIENEIVQKIDNSYVFNLKGRKFDGTIEDAISEFIVPFNLQKNPLFRVELITLKEEDTYLLIDMHHVITDGISMNILKKEFITLYNGNELEPLRIQYKDFAEWQNSLWKTEDGKKQEKYWLNMFNDEIPILNMPTDYERPIMQSFEGDLVKFEIDEKLTEKLRHITRKTGTTMHMVLLSAFNIIISKYNYNGQDDIIVGIPIAGRIHADLDNMIGMFVNTLALRNKPESDKKYIDFLNEVKDNSLKAYENQSYQFETLIEKLNIRRDTSRNPLFDVMFSITNTADVSNNGLDDIILKEYNTEGVISKFDITLNALDDNSKIYFSMEYCTNLFKKETIERLSKHFVKVLNLIASNTEAKIGDMEVLFEYEKNKILYDFNNTRVDYPKDKTIQELFEIQVEKTPDSIAVVYEDKKLTYRELNEKANSLARVLRKKGVKAESIVGIMVDRSIEMVVAILGIIKSGAAYLPIDPNYPNDRMIYILENSNASLLITDPKLIKEINLGCSIIDINDSNINLEDSSNLEIMNSQKDLLYVLYTSGTTGNPKGVMVEQRNVVNMAYSWIEKYQLYKFKVELLQMASMYFDVFTGDLCRSLLTGGTMHICPTHVRIDIEALYNLMIKSEINIFESTPSLVMTFMNYVNDNNLSLDSLKLLIIGSDTCAIEDYKNLVRKYGKDVRVINSYGITEATIDSSYYEENEDNILSNLANTPIEKPLPNSKFYILDKGLKPLPIGVIGELYIGGAGVSRGYYNNEELTKIRFLDNPFEPGEKMYKTGDFAKWHKDGNVEFLGRIDNQVKIRGFRIELSEIENKLLQCEGIKDVVVMVRGNKENDKYICAYVVYGKECNTLDLTVYLKDYLKESIPDYMIPSYFIRLSEIPLTPNGKVDRRALPEPKKEDNLYKYKSPRDKVDEMLVRIWSELLGRDNIGINDNFFDLGGHSLKATVLITKIHKEFNVQVPLKELFKLPTIEGLGNYIKNANKDFYTNIEKVEEEEYYKVSSAQKRIYMLWCFDKMSIAYNMPSIFEVKGEVNKEKIEQVFKKLIKRHDLLRTYFENHNGTIVQVLNDCYEFKLIDKRQHEKVEVIIENFIRPFDLEKGPLFRVELIGNEEKSYLLIDIHHIISDGISTQILIKEFTALYNGQILEPLKLQYKDFAIWQNNFLKSEEMKRQEKYWISVFNDEIPVLCMPYDYKRPIMQTYEGDSVQFEVNENLTEELRRITRKTGTTMHMVLLSAFNILLSKYSNQEDIVIGIPIAGRLHENLQNMIGMFVNTLVMRNKPQGEKNFIEFLEEVKENSLRAYENQSYQFEQLVEKLNIRKDISRNPLFDVMFSMINKECEEEFNLDEFALSNYSVQNKISKFDLTLNALEKDKTLEFSLDYCSKLFTRKTMERLCKHYIKILNEIAKNNEIMLSEIHLITDEEKEQILLEFNDTKTEYTKYKSIQEMFEDQVEKTPNNIAVVYQNKQLTYKELNEKANSLARLLRENGVMENSIVGIMVDRSLEMIIGIMAILKSGGAYLPIDSEYPKERIEYIIRNSNVKVLLTETKFIDEIELDGIKLNIHNDKIYNKIDGNLMHSCNYESLAYVIYTSGSTGKPKGVLIKHKNVINLVNGLNKKVLKEPNEKFIVNPYNSQELMYKTGDIGKLLEDGNIQFVRRNDNQVKIMGYRIELAEIEGALLNMGYIKNTVVLPKIQSDGEKLLYAYIVTDNNIQIKDIRKELTKTLPKYMIPSHFIRLDKLPTTLNGKIDRDVIESVEGYQNYSTSYKLPKGKIETKIFDIWKDELNLDKLGIDQDFFELGGTSLKLIQILYKLNKEFNLTLSLGKFLELSTIENLAAYIEDIQNSNLKEVGKYVDMVKLNKSNNIMILNSKKNKNIFAFPPLSGFGIAYSELAKKIDTYSFYGIDFILDEDRIEKYSNQIMAINGEQPYVLFAHSSGGVMCFEVAKRLIEKGCNVTDIIFLDAYKKGRSINLEEDKLNSMVENFCNRFISVISSSGYVIDKLEEVDFKAKVRNHYLFVYNTINYGKVKSNIHFIIEDVKDNLSKQEENIWELWNNSTSKSYKLYNGFGEHVEMINGEYLIKNVEIIEMILESIN